ncbi:MAG TPA: hypothetical protein VFP84_10170 [Kofleriaceae bacterium]|nr:hypothetical protein [Kofleriaceae bacterium]
MGGHPGGPGGPMGPPGMPPMGGPRPPMMQPPARQGTSRMVPVVVSAGLAIGVFCGLLFGLGTGKSKAAVPASNGVNAHANDEPFVPEPMSTTKPPDRYAAKGSAAGSAGSAAGSAVAAAGAGSAAGSGSAAAPEAKKVKVAFEVKPESLRNTVKLSVDGKDIDGLSTEIALEPGVDHKSVHFVAKAPGFADYTSDSNITSKEGETSEATVAFEMVKGKSTLGAAVATTPPAGTGSAATPTAVDTGKPTGTAAAATKTGGTGTGATGTGATGTGTGTGKTNATGTGTKPANTNPKPPRKKQNDGLIDI